ncbi:hypothetical protein D3C78_428030 [compost metagenome]
MTEVVVTIKDESEEVRDSLQKPALQSLLDQGYKVLSFSKLMPNETTFVLVDEKTWNEHQERLNHSCRNSLGHVFENKT